MNKAPEVVTQPIAIPEAISAATGSVATITEVTAYTGTEDAGAAMPVGSVVLGSFDKRTSEDVGAGWKD